MSFTEDEARQAVTYAINGAMFMFRASADLSAEILIGGQASVGLPEFLKIMMIKREWINIDSEMVIKYCRNTIDARNKYIYDNGDIKVIPEPIKI